MRKLATAPFRYLTNSSYRKYIHGTYLQRLGYSREHWNRVVQIREWHSFLETLEWRTLDVLEISPGRRSIWRNRGFRSYRDTHFPAFDICRQTLNDRFDLIIADNVFEHLATPHQASQNVAEMLKPGGWFMVATPFLYRVHGSPNDFSRWTREGLCEVLANNGFARSNIRVDSWGNIDCVRASLKEWQFYGWGRNLTNDPSVPIIVWAFAQKST